MPFLLSMIGHLISKKTKNDVNRKDENVQVQNKLTGLSSILSKWDFFLQLPIINIIQNFRLWKELRKAIKEEQLHDGQNEKDAVMRVDSKIQTFRMYQTFGDQIPEHILWWADGIRQDTIVITSIGSFYDIFTKGQ